MFSLKMSDTFKLSFHFPIIFIILAYLSIGFTDKLSQPKLILFDFEARRLLEEEDGEEDALGT